MATSQEYAAWLRANQNKQGTPDYQTVLRAFQEARLEELQAQTAAPSAQPQPESGFGPAFRAGVEGLLGAGTALAGRTGLMDMAEAEKAVEARRQRQAEIFKPTEEWGITKLTELLGGSIPYMAAPLAAAGAAAALPLTGTAAAVAGLGAAGLTSATQFTGTNLSRQIEEGKKLAETDLGAAALAAIPQAALDTLSMRMLPGVGKLLGDAGIKVTKETAKEVSEQILKKAAIDYAAATGRAMTAEGLTEAAQQGFERLQAGLSLTDADARKEYFDSLVGGALLGGTIAPAGRMLERGKAKREVAAIEQEEADTAAKAAREAEEARKQQPEYMEGLYTTYQDLLAQKKALDAQIKKGSKEAPLSQDDKDANSVINRQLAELKQPLRRAQQAFIDAGGPQALAAARTRQLQPTPEEVPGTEQELEAQRRERLLAELDRAQLIGDTKRASALQQQLQESAPESPEALRSRLTRDVPYLQALLERQREQIQAAKTPEAAAEIAARAQKTYEALAQANARLGELSQAPDIAELQQKEQALLKAFEDAREAGDQEAVLKVVPELQEARRQLQEARRQLQEAQPFDLTSEAYAAEEDRKRAELGEAMGAGREIAAAEREQAGTEQQVAREQAARSAALQEQLELEGTAEREAMSELAASRAADMRMRELEALRGAPQLALFPEQRKQVVRTEVEQTERERPAEVAPLRSELAKLLRERRGLERQAAQAQPAPGAELAGPASLFVVNTQDRIRTLDTRIAEIEEQLTGLTAPGTETRTTRVAPEAPQPDLRPQGPLAARLNTLAERVLASPRVDEDTKALVREVQDNLPFLLRQDPVAQRTLGRRGALLAGQQEGQSVGAWLYRTMLGTAPPELTENIRDRLRKLEAVRRSETERLPTGELRRAVQTEIELPEPTATAFESFADFSDYLASEGLQAYRLQKGLVFPTLANIQKRLAPIQARVDELQKQLADVNAKQEALQKADAAERSSASKLLRESQQKLQALVQTLDDTARTTYVGAKYKQVDLVDLLDQAHGRLNAALAHSSNLRQQFAQALNNITSAEEAAKPVMVDASGRITTDKNLSVRSVAQGQLPAYQALRDAQLELQKKGLALVEADQQLEQVVKSGIGQSWDAGSPTLRAYISAKKAKDEAQRAAQQAHYALLQAYRRVPSKKTLNKNLSTFLSEKASLDAEMAKAAKSLSAIRLGVRNASNRLNDSYVKMENIPELQFGDNLLRLRQDLLTAQNSSEETMGRSVERQAQAEQLAREASTVAQPLRTMKRQVESTLGEARERAEARRGVPAKETQGEREARDAALRREEQARLERQEAIPGTRIEFEREETKDTTLDSLIVKAEMAKTREERAAVVKETQDYLNARVAKLDNDLKEMQAKAAKNIKDVQQARKNVAALTERLEKNVTEKGRQMTPKQRETAERKLEEAKRKLAEHERRYTMNTREMKIKRTDIQAERAAKKQALADVQSRFEPGQRLGEAEGTTAGRAIGPVTRPEVYPPKTMRTGSEESRMGVTTTDTRQRLQEARGVRQRDIAMTSEEMQAAEQAAAEMKTLAGLEKAEKALAAEREAADARGLRPGEFDRFEAREKVLKARRATLEREKSAVEPAEPEAEAPEVEAPGADVEELQAAEEAAEEAAEKIRVERERTNAQEANKLAEELRTKPAESEAEAPEVEEEAEEAPKKRGRKAAAVEEMEEALDSFEVEVLPGENQEVFFSRGAPVEGLTKEKVTEELERALGQKGLFAAQNVVTIVNSVADLKRLKKLPSTLRDNLDAIPDDAKGFVYDGKAYLIAKNIGKDHALGVLLHEVGAHIGFRNFFNTAQYNALVETVRRWSKSKANTLEARIGRAAMERVQAAQTSADQINDELLAYAVEEAFNAGVEPTGVKGGNAVQNWLRMLVDGFKRALEKFGLAPEKLKVGDLVNMAYGAANLELRGTWHGTGKPFKEFDFAYMGSGEGAQVYGWGTYRAQAHSTAKFYQRQEAEKQLRQWRNDPKIKDWKESLTDNIMFDGRKLSSERDRLQKLVQSDNAKTSRDAFADLYVFDLLARRAQENNFGRSPAKLAENIAKKGELIGLDNETKAAAQKTIDRIIAGDLKVVMPFQGELLLQNNVAYYKNQDYLESTIPTEIWILVDDLVDTAVEEAKAKAYAPVAEALQRVYKEKLAAYDRLARAGSTYHTQKAINLRKIDVDAIVYHPLPEPPIPEPKGAFAWVMSTRPDEEYYVLDLPLDQQAPKVQNAISELLNSTDVVKDKAELRNVLNANMDSADRASKIGSALHWIPPKPGGRKNRSDKEISYLLRSYGIAGYKYLDAPSRDRVITRDSKFNYVDFYDKDEGPAIVAWNIDRVGPAEGILFSRNLPTASRVANDLIGTQPTWLDNLKANFLGLGARTQFIDKYAPTEEALKRGKVEDLKANQARYYLRMYDQRMHFTSQAISDGAPVIVEKTRRDGRVERVVETAPGASISKVVDLLKRKDVIKEAGSADDANKLFTLYLAAIRGERVGFDRLNFGRAWAEAEIGRVEDELRSATLSPETRGNLQKKKASLEKRLDSMPTEADIKAAKAEIDANPVLSEAFREARDVYNAYNRDLMKFAMDTGAIGKELGNKLLASNDYIPYYRMRDGVAQLMIGKETPVRIGNLKDSPHLQELVGGDEAIFDFLTSSVQNTSMLIDMSMKNLATKNLMFELRDVGLAKISKVKGGNAPTGSVTFKKDGEEYFAVVDTDALGIDSELLVKGLAGIPTMFPQMVRVLGMPARLLRRLVVASPVYMARQLVRDSTAAAIASGANMTPVISALRQIGKPSMLERRGITGGQVFTGMPEDQTRLLKEMQAGKIGLTSGLARLEALSAKADALTREAQYESYREQGLSEMEATLMALESMNFSRRGLSPTMHMLSTLIPFFNAQIQGLDVLYRSLRGHMPFNEQLEVRKKLITRGAMLFGMSLVYASMMQDDEAYKNAKVEEKYSNFFMPLPGTDQLLRIPIPFELGYIFKALPEALVNTFAREEGGEEALKALTFIAKQTVPGLSSYFLPQAVKPALEVALDQSIYTGRDIESAQEKLVEPGHRFRDNTTELAREVGEQTGVSPIKLEYLIRGYTGGMGMALVQAVSAPFGRTGPEAATKRPSDVPVVGTLFQPADASGIIDSVYERMNKARQVQETYESLVKKGRQDAAQAYLDRNLDSFALASLAGSFKQQMGEITKYEQTVRASNLTADQKREALDRARQAKINLAKAVRAASDRTERQAAPA